MAMLSYSRAIADNAARQPDRIAISCANESITWAEFEARTNRVARAYAALGVTSGSFVTVGLPNSIAFFEACVAVWKLGATPQPMRTARCRCPRREPGHKRSRSRQF